MEMDLCSGKSHERILTLARKLLDDPLRWSRDARARDIFGQPVHPRDNEAVAWCVEGAVGICANKNAIVPLPLLELLDAAAVDVFSNQIKITHLNAKTKEVEAAVWPYVDHESVGYVNDKLGYHAVLLVLDRAIELSRQR